MFQTEKYSSYGVVYEHAMMSCIIVNVGSGLCGAYI